mmetsp:Transcript_17971/g.35106  ORF Transcript_17971/g.35106 Transcript_17971/m.35106 type:complete len:172 (-) Transcript_17971:904-1419(-)
MHRPQPDVVSFSDTGVQEEGKKGATQPVCLCRVHQRRSASCKMDPVAAKKKGNSFSTMVVFCFGVPASSLLFWLCFRHGSLPCILITTSIVIEHVFTLPQAGHFVFVDPGRKFIFAAHRNWHTGDTPAKPPRGLSRDERRTTAHRQALKRWKEYRAQESSEKLSCGLWQSW